MSASVVRTPDFKLSIGTIEFTDALKTKVSEITVEQVSDGASSFKVVLDDSDKTFSDAKQSIREGASCKIELGYSDDGEGTKQVIEGFVTGVKPYRKEGSRQLFVVNGFDGLSKLMHGRKRRAWENIKDSDIASEIANECGLKPDVEDSGIVQPYVVQNNENNLNFLFERARRIGYEVKVVERSLVFKKPRVKPSVATFRTDGVDVEEKGGFLLQRMDFNSSMMNVPSKVVVRSYDPATAEPIIAEADTSSYDKMGGKKHAGEINPDGPVLQISDQPVRSQEEAKQLAQSIFDQRAGEFMTGTGRCIGNNAIQAGNKVTMADVGQDVAGDYYVTSAKHIMKLGRGRGCGYWTEFTVSRSGR